ncbi:LppA family lipoprotein [Mycoplasma mycoides]|uniref:LppA family lipoprotein n=1 Tax=Mycoplasma mycoides subsp. capri TaxID=40477 RepID=A0AB38GDS6_MYCMC|nr:LppA family lipoprotein [Mycoplasma mycoides]ADH22147.1 mycoides cluster lipoprotein, LppA/P72 family [synthetic Mycoplasma mycoides JCVI-syn1.0]ACU78331.1 mycoides cluster lipoprotein, LppA/P72 family [Mycoplasma mycoides subsp. capri str. GM12]ACU79160.1 mycoides cluster lipoprotein, LppA/P72 family [Mycoplasma mycoides subsp. capri str. GM12]SRX58239.1 LppA family lipoprotein [Mycoplasma mycoides subsp. capri]SRX60806.1 LppA family lipoprotein [Mycoplasma mycoides subsp. capri]
MKKAIKLLLSILPISSISVLGVVSCSTTNLNAKQPDKKPGKPNENTPKTPSKPDESKQPDNNNTNPGNSNNDPNNPETKPDPSEKPQSDQSMDKPDEKNDKPSHSDKPQADDSNNNRDTFSDLDKISKEISFRRFSFYTQRDAVTALIDLQKDPSTIYTIFSKDYITIFDKYHIQFLANNGENANNQKGLIEKVKLKFTDKKVGKSKILEFTFTWFKKFENSNNTNNKEKYITKKEKVEKITDLFPSLIGYMLLYSQDHNQYENLMETKNVINFEDLENGNSSLFTDEAPLLNVATIKDYLFEFNPELGKLYKEKITAVRYDDYNGILGVKLEIENRDFDPKTTKEPIIEKEFVFDNFRKVNIKDNEKNPLSLFLTQDKFKEMTKSELLKTKIQELRSSNKLEKKELLQDKKIDFLKQQIFKNLLVDINDNSHNIYRSQSTLGLGSNKTYKSILGLKGGFSIYPFHTSINKDSIKNIYLSINKDEENVYKAVIEFEVHIPVFSTGFSDLKSYATSGDEKYLVLKIVQTTSIQ